MQLKEFNKLSETDVLNFLRNCVHIKSWGTAIADQRPFDSINELYEFAQQQTKFWTWDEIKTALDTHPRIGEKNAKKELSAQEAEFSDKEQSALSTDQEIIDEIYKGNVSYEKRFGYIFLIKASGLNSGDILTALRYRLVNDPDTEKRIVHQQLLEIALLRLKQEVQE